MSFEGVSSDLFIRDPLTKEAARVRSNSLQVIGAFFSLQEVFTGNNTIGQQFTMAHLPVKNNVFFEITTDGVNWTTFTAFTVNLKVITTAQAIPSTPANNIRITYFIAEMTQDNTIDSPELVQQITQLSTLIDNTDLVSPNVSFQVTQLSSIIDELGGLSLNIGTIIIDTQHLDDLIREASAATSDGLTNVILATVEGFTNVYLLLGQEVAQLSQVEVHQVDSNTLLAQEVGQLSQIITNTSASGADTTQILSHQVTQLSTIELYGSQQVDQLSNLNVSVSLEISQLTTIDLTTRDQITQLSTVIFYEAQQIGQLTTIQLYDSQIVSQLTQVETNQSGQTSLLAQEVDQLSQIITNTGVVPVDVTPILSHEVTQLSTLEALSSQQVTQLSNLNVSVAVEISQLTTIDLTTMSQITQLSTTLLYESQMVGQLSQVEINQTNQTSLLAQEVGQLSQIVTNTGVADIDLRPYLNQEITQLSTIELYGSQQVSQLSNLNVSVVLEVTQLSTVGLYEYEQVAQLTSIDARLSNVVSQLTTIELYTFQEVGQLSNIISNTSGETGEVPLLSQQVTQLSTKIVQESQMISQLTTLELYSSQQVGQLSNTYTILNGISIVDGRVLISSQPPDAPPSTVSVIRTAQSTFTGTADDIYTITNLKKLTILRFRGGAAVGGTGAKVEIYYDPNGTGVGMTLIDAGYVSGSNFVFDESSSQTYTGNGTKAIRMRRTRFGGGTLEIYGRWDGYEL